MRERLVAEWEREGRSQEAIGSLLNQAHMASRLEQLERKISRRQADAKVEVEDLEVGEAVLAFLFCWAGVYWAGLHCAVLRCAVQCSAALWFVPEPAQAPAAAPASPVCRCTALPGTACTACPARRLSCTGCA